MATYQQALDRVFRLTGVSNGGVMVLRVGANRGIACVETNGGIFLGQSPFDWHTVTADMIDRPVTDVLDGRSVESRA